jgi:hypothetical protein
MAVEMSDKNQRRKRVHGGKWTRVQAHVPIGAAVVPSMDDFRSTSV